MNTTKTTILLCIVSLFYGCNKDNKEEKKTHTETMIEKFKKKDQILIMHNYPSSTCVSQTLKNSLLSKEYRIKDLDTYVEDNTIDCQAYERQNDGVSCLEKAIATNATKACVIGYNIKINNMTDTQAISVDLPDIIEDIL